MIELPQSPETEAAVIAAWFSQEKFAAAWRPTPTLFAGVTNRVLVEAMAELSLATRDQVSLAAVLATRGSLERVGGTQGVFRAINLAPSVGDPWPHVERLTRYAALRNLLVGIETASATGARTHDLEATTTDVQAALRAAVGMSGVKPLSVAELLEAAAIDAMRVGMPVERCPTGIPAFDQDSGGLRPEHVAVMGAATNYGKSSLAIMLADESLRSGRGVLIATFEDAPELYGRRLLARRAQVNAFRLREHLLRDDELERVKVTAEKGERQPFLLDARGRAAEHVASDVRSLCASDGLALVLVDYVQAARTETARQDRRNEVTYVARVLTDAIKTSHAAGVLFSQIRRLLSRGERPTKFDLKECLAGDQVVVDARDGRRWTVRELAACGGVGATAYTMRPDWQFEPQAVADAWPSGRKVVFNLRTRTGRVLRGAATHPLRTVGGWRTIGGLKVGDRVAVAMGVPTPTETSGLSVEQARLLGYLVGDGFYARSTVSFVNADYAILADASSLVSSLFPGMVTRQWVGTGGRAHNQCFTKGRLGCGRSPLNLWLRSLGIFGQCGPAKRAPDAVMAASDEAVGAFLGGLIATDGSVVVGRGGAWTVKLSSVSPGLLADVHWLFARLGIVAVKERETWNTKSRVPIATMRITDHRALLRLCERVPICGYKSWRLAVAAAAIQGRRSNMQVDRLPAELNTEIAEERRAAGIGYYKLGYQTQGKAVGRRHLVHVAKVLGRSDWNALAEAPVLWDRIESIDAAGEEDTFDLSVPPHANFVVNGFVTHNSGDVENAAELVMIGYEDEQSRRCLAVDKCKDGEKGTYQLFWDGNACCFTGGRRLEGAGAEG